MTNSPQPSLGAHGSGSPSLRGGVRAFPGSSNQAIIRRASWQLCIQTLAPALGTY